MKTRDFLILTFLIVTFSASSQDCAGCKAPYSDARCMECFIKSLQNKSSQKLQEEYSISPKTAKKIESIPNRNKLEKLGDFFVHFDDSEKLEIRNYFSSTYFIQIFPPTIPPEEQRRENERNEVMRLGTDECLGDLLLEGYKSFMAKHGGRIPKHCSRDEAKEIFKFVLSASNKHSHQVNILTAQSNLLSRSIFTCENQAGVKSKNWQFKINKLNKIPRGLFEGGLSEIESRSKMRNIVLNESDDFFKLRKEKITMITSKDLSSHQDTRSRYYDGSCVPVNYTYLVLKLSTDN